MTQLKIFKTNPEVVLPTFGTQQAACFDIAFQAYGKYEYAGYSGFNAPFTRTLKDGKAILMPGDRIMVPTGLIFDIPQGYSLRIHPRSGLSYKQGLVLANLEAVIDSDYFQETFVLLTNHSENPITISNGDRIAQAELVQSLKYDLIETAEVPAQKTDRVGGLGSTGTVTKGTVTRAGFTTEVVGLAPIMVNLTESEEPVKRGRGRPKKVATT